MRNRHVRVLHKRGVQFRGIYYQSEELQTYRLKVGDCRVDIDVDPQDPGKISVAIGEEWISVPAVLAGFNELDLET